MPVTAEIYEKRRQRLFLILSGMFLGTLAMLNILGISRFLDLSFDVFGITIPMVVAIGVLPYRSPSYADLISEHGEKKAPHGVDERAAECLGDFPALVGWCAARL